MSAILCFKSSAAAWCPCGPVLGNVRARTCTPSAFCFDARRLRAAETMFAADRTAMLRQTMLSDHLLW